ncbi:hypothetical protein DRP53_08765 [candidate division WOR-3 bacterium]|uniref:Aminopeptidase N n=1 Tax=candidate division WOR-3 bacterium TaxID=2052148 RepID=A0A660SGZ3_UNCW3|nr:MAG: hypothetical protein DRP53_08765 [candidate division WOR-3 bacterium]
MVVPLIIMILSDPIETKFVLYPDAVLAESTHSYDVLHYRLNLDLPMDSNYLSGIATIASRSNEDNLAELDLHLDVMRVDSIKVDGITAIYQHNGETLHIYLPHPYNQGDSFDIMVGYSGKGSGGMGFLWYNTVHKIAYTLGCPFCTRKWMPCWDRLWDKADYGVEFYITVPDSYTACANGVYLGRQVQGGKATYHWKESYPIAPYLIHFAASIFSTYSDWFHKTPTESIEIKYFFWPEDSISARNAFKLCVDMISFYDSLYGDYPFERYGMDVVYPFYYGGMEHQTLATINRVWLSQQNYYGIAHEMSHMWWGDMVTCFGWANVWLNEGFATYSDALYLERREGHQAFINKMIERRNDYFRAEQSNPHPVYNPPEHLIFEWGHTYCKGSWILHMIRYLCGDDQTWLNLLATYRDSFAYRNASTDDLNRIMNQVLGENYNWFFDEWVYSYWYPEYEINWKKRLEGSNWRFIVDISQKQSHGPKVFHMPVEIRINFSSGDTIVKIPITQSPEHYEVLLSREPVSIDFDPNVWLIEKSTIVSVAETPTDRISFTRIKTVAPEIDIELNRSAEITVYDITGRLVYRTHTQRLRYSPPAAGIYQIRVGELRTRVVVIR